MTKVIHIDATPSSESLAKIFLSVAEIQAQQAGPGQMIIDTLPSGKFIIYVSDKGVIDKLLSEHNK